MDSNTPRGNNISLLFLFPPLILYDNVIATPRFFQMSNYEESKKARRIVAVVYLLIMTILVGGTYLSQQHTASEQEFDDLSFSDGAPVYVYEQTP